MPGPEVYPGATTALHKTIAEQHQRIVELGDELRDERATLDAVIVLLRKALAVAEGKDDGQSTP